MRRELRRVDEYLDPARVRGFDDLVDGRDPSGDVGRTRDREQPWYGPRVEHLDDVVDGERAARAALDVAPACVETGPRQQIRVMLRDGHHDRRIRVQPQAVRELIDRFGGVAADDRDVVAVGATREVERGGAGFLVGGGRDLRLVAGSAMHARVPREELVHALDHRRQGRGRSGRVERQVRPFGTVDARHQLIGADQAYGKNTHRDSLAR
jgi:hypothetical protein